MRSVLSSVLALMLAGLSASVISCGGAIVDDVVDPPAASTLITATEGPISAAAAAYAVTRAAGEAASEAQVPSFVVSTDGNGFKDKQRTYVFNSDNGDWTTTGDNAELVTFSFFHTLNLDSGTKIRVDITDWDNLASGGSLEGLLAENGGLETTKILMELEVSTLERTFGKILVSSVWIDYITDGGEINSSRVAYATGSTASYSLTGEGYGTLTSDKTIVINSLTATVTELGAKVTGDAQFTIPMDDMEYTVSCTFDATGCTEGTVLDPDGAEAGTIRRVSGTDIVFTDSVSGTDTIISW